MPDEPWRDPARTTVERVADLLDRMTLEEKVAQLYGVWVGVTADGDDVAPHQHDLADESLDWKAMITNGLGQLTRPFGTVPVEPARGAHLLAGVQAEISEASRFGIGAIAHEECLTGLMAWRATVFPTPLAWGATFNPDLIRQMAAEIGRTMRAIGIHQGLAPVLDVARDPRWGRTEETIGEDPHLVGTIGAAYTAGLESAGVVATLKHFAGYSASRAARNHAPVAIGPREFADVLLPPFELALRHGGARSVMHAYVDVDGVPAGADTALLTGLLRDDWGFDGTVVADYFGVSFLELLHGVAESPGHAAELALRAGVDIELPTVRCFGAPLLDRVREPTDRSEPHEAVEAVEAVDTTGLVELIDRAAGRVLAQKCELGLLDPDWKPLPAELTDTIDLDPPAARELARRIAEESVALLTTDGTLPLRSDARIAVTGPVADDPLAMLGCYAFPNHVARQHPDLELGVELPSVLAALREEFAGVAPATDVAPAANLDVAGHVALDVTDADVVIAVFGDRAGLFGHGTSGEGCDAEDLRLPDGQEDELERVLDLAQATGTPVVLVLLTGRPYALGRFADRVAAIVQAFFPGEEGGAAVAGVLSGRVCPSGRLPIGVPRSAGGQPATFLAPRLAQRSKVSAIDPTPLFPFGHGLSYTEFTWHDPHPTTEVTAATDGTLTASVVVRNVGDRTGAEVVQLYVHDPVAQVTRPVHRLIGYARVELAPGESRRVTFDVHADLTSFIGKAGYRLVEPGRLELRLGASSTDIRYAIPARLTGPERRVGFDRVMLPTIELDDPDRNDSMNP